MTKIDEEMKALVNLLTALDEPGKRAIVLQTYVQTHGPIPDEYKKIIGEAMNGKKPETHVEPPRCLHCGEFIKGNHCYFCGWGLKPGHIILDTDDIEILMCRCNNFYPREIAIDMLEEIEKQIVKKTAIEFAEKLIREGYIKIDIKKDLDMNRYMVEFQMTAKMRAIKPDAGIQ